MAYFGYLIEVRKAGVIDMPDDKWRAWLAEGADFEEWMEHILAAVLTPDRPPRGGPRGRGSTSTKTPSWASVRRRRGRKASCRPTRR
jgi:hypothetical protein